MLETKQIGNIHFFIRTKRRYTELIFYIEGGLSNEAVAKLRRLDEDYLKECGIGSGRNWRFGHYRFADAIHTGAGNSYLIVRNEDAVEIANKVVAIIG